MPTSSIGTTDATARCVEFASVFQDPLLEERLPASAPKAVRRRQIGLVSAAQSTCRACPLIADRSAETATPTKPTIDEVLAAAAAVICTPLAPGRTQAA
jgi:hypothetical protein